MKIEFYGSMDQLVQYLKRHAFASIILLAVILRLFYVLLLSDHWQLYDTIHYVTAARNIVEGNGFGPSMHFGHKYGSYCLEPIYPIFIAGVYALFGFSGMMVKIFQIVIAVVQMTILYDLCRLFRSQVIMRLALVFSAVYPFYIIIVGLVYPTQLFATLIMILVWFLIRYVNGARPSYLLCAGVIYGLAIQTGPVLSPSVPFVLFWLWRYAGNRYGDMILFTGCLILTLTPWIVRNYLVFNKLAPGRACLEEQRFINNFYYELLEQKSLQDSVFTGRKVGICFAERGGYTWIDGYIDEKQIVAMHVLNDRLPIAESRYLGVLFEGKVDNRISRLVTYQSDCDRAEDPAAVSFDSADSMDHIATQGMVYENPAIELIEPLNNKWQNKLIHCHPIKANYFTFFLPNSSKPDHVRRMALLVYLDKADLSANGYMVWLQSSYQFDVWKVKDGRPYESLLLEKHFFNRPSVDLLTVLTREPMSFIFDHYLPELLNFWSPLVRKLENPPFLPWIFMQTLSFLFFLPILVLAPIGMVWHRNQQTLLWLSVIFIATVALGYSVFSAEIRYRIPIDGFLIIWAAAGATVLWQNFSLPAKNKSD